MGVEFGFSGLSNIGLSPVKGGSIGVKKAMDGDNYFIGRFGFGLSRDTDEAMATGWTDEKDGMMQFAAGLGLQHNLPACNHLVPYLGGMVEFSYSSSYNEPSVQEPVAANTLTKTTTSGMGLGLKAMVGGEYFFWQCMSLSGEYTFGFSYTSSKTEWEYEGADNVESKMSGFDFGPFSTANVRLTMYWD